MTRRTKENVKNYGNESYNAMNERENEKEG